MLSEFHPSIDRHTHTYREREKNRERGRTERGIQREGGGGQRERQTGET